MLASLLSLIGTDAAAHAAAHGASDDAAQAASHAATHAAAKAAALAADHAAATLQAPKLPKKLPTKIPILQTQTWNMEFGLPHATDPMPAHKSARSTADRPEAILAGLRSAMQCTALRAAGGALSFLGTRSGQCSHLRVR